MQFHESLKTGAMKEITGPVQIPKQSSRCRNFSDLNGRTDCNKIVNFVSLQSKNKR